MKLYSSTLCTVLLCGNLLLSLSPACAPKPKSNSPTPEPATATPPTTTATSSTTMPAITTSPTATPPTTTPTAKLTETPPIPSTATPTPTPLAGTYTLNDPGATERIRKAIDGSVSKMSFLVKGLAGDRLKKKNLPPPGRLVISYSPTEVNIETDITGKVRTSADDTPSNWKWDGDTYKVSTRWEGGKLVRTFIGGGGRRVNVYSLRDNGKTLNMHVTVTREDSPKLTKPLTYQLVYKRS